MITKEDAWEAYTSTWAAPTDDARMATFAECLADDCVYTDPNIRAAGWNAINEYMNGFQQQLPGGGFRTTQFASHHDVALVSWEMVDGSGNAVGTGTSVGTFGEGGRLTSMTGFFEQPA